MTVRKKQTPNKEVEIKTVKQLKFWLKGIQEFQDDGWLPDAKQWKRICDIILNLNEEEIQENYDRNHSAPQLYEPAYVPPTFAPQPTFYNSPPESDVLALANKPMSELRRTIGNGLSENFNIVAPPRPDDSPFKSSLV